MQTFFTFLISFLTLAISLVFIFRLYGINFILTIPGSFYFFYIIFIYLGSSFVLIQNNFNSIPYYTATHFGLILPILGMFLGSHFSNIDSKSSFYSYLSLPIIDKYRGLSFNIPFIILCLLSVGISLKYLSLIEIPIFYLFGDVESAATLAKLREIATTTLKNVKLHRYKFFTAQVFPFLSIIAYYKMKLHNKFKWRLIFLVLLAISSFLAIADLQKKPILAYFLMLFIASSLFNRKINYRKIIIITVIFLLLLILMYSSIMGLSERPLSDILEAISRRLFQGQSYPLDIYMKTFPAKHDYLYGTSFPNPGGIFPYKPFPLTRYVFKTNLGLTDIAVTAPTVFFGEIYANFGYYIMLVSMVSIGLLLHLIQKFFQNREKDVIGISFYAFYVIYCMQLALTSFFVVFHLYLVLFAVFSIFLKTSYKLIEGSIGMGRFNV